MESSTQLKSQVGRNKSGESSLTRAEETEEQSIFDHPAIQRMQAEVLAWEAERQSQPTGGEEKKETANKTVQQMLAERTNKTANETKEKYHPIVGEKKKGIQQTLAERSNKKEQSHLVDEDNKGVKTTNKTVQQIPGERTNKVKEQSHMADEDKKDVKTTNKTVQQMLAERTNKKEQHHPTLGEGKKSIQQMLAERSNKAKRSEFVDTDSDIERLTEGISRLTFAKK